MGALFSALMAKITGAPGDGAMLEVENDATCDCTCCATTYEVPDAPDCSAQHATDEHNFDEVPVPGLDDGGSWKTVEPTDSQKTKLDI